MCKFCNERYSKPITPSVGRMWYTARCLNCSLHTRQFGSKKIEVEIRQHTVYYIIPIEGIIDVAYILLYNLYILA
jgi:hypothetical protein